MAKSVLIDELHVTLRVPITVPERDAIRRTLAGVEFMARLRRAVRVAIRAIPELASVRATLTR